MYNAIRCLKYATFTLVLYAVYKLSTSGLPKAVWARLEQQSIMLPASQVALITGAVLLGVFIFIKSRDRPTYLLDFECMRPSEELKVTYKYFVAGSRNSGYFDEDAMEFQERILNKSALSNETFVPAGLHLDVCRTDMLLAREEAEIVMFGAVEDLLAKTGLKPRDIDVLVVNCSLFNPTPSLSAMVINHFKMRSDIDSFSLGGMGCSAGVIAIDLARKALKARSSGGYALIVSTENISQNWYKGCERSMLIPNTIFRMGAAAILLTDKRTERWRAKYQLEHLVRVHLGADDVAYRCVYQHPDSKGVIGVELNKDLVSVAAKAMTVNLTRLGPLVLPLSEKLSFAMNWVARKLLGIKVAPYVPDFKRAFNHFCLHVGGRGVVEGLSKQLGLSKHQMSPSANTLYWYGNTSSSTVWYSFGYVESAHGVKRGERVWQIGFGSGFKCNSAVWKALRSVKTTHRAWQHLKGRETEAMDTLARVAEESALERAAKVDTTDKSAKTNGNGYHTNSHLHADSTRMSLRSKKVLH